MTLSGVADGAEGLIVADLARAVAAKPNAPATSLVVICRDGPRMAQLARALAFFAPEIEINEFPAWDCLPYDRVSPHPGVVAQRMTTLSRLARLQGREKPGVVLTTVNAALQRVPPRSLIATQALSAAPGNMLAMDGVMQWLELNGYNRTSTVREPGDYAVRGGIVDLYPPGMGDPVRLDFFGDTLESIRSFDAETQRSQNDLRALDLVPVAEFQLTSETIRRFRQGYVEAFGTSANDPLYEAVSRGPPPSRHGALAAAVPQRPRHAVRLCAGRGGRARAARRGRRARAPRADHRLLRGAAPGARRRPRQHRLQAAAAGPALSARGQLEVAAWANARWPG